MTKRKIAKGLIIDVFLVIFWIAVFLYELLYTQDMIWLIVALVCIFIFSLLLGKDIRKQAARV
ncbi:MAG: hypothetical protein O2U62_04860 [Candidatus Bathyarchaeota archaeon]|nr:hypothetical protein [Candidatus Bathyarchaeota archaeon]